MLDGDGAISRFLKKPGLGPNERHLPQQLKSKAKDGAKSVSQIIDWHMHAIPVQKAHALGINAVEFNPVRKEAFLIDERLDALQKVSAVLVFIKLLEPKLAQPRKTFSECHILTENR